MLNVTQRIMYHHKFKMLDDKKKRLLTHEDTISELLKLGILFINSDGETRVNDAYPQLYKFLSNHYEVGIVSRLTHQLHRFFHLDKDTVVIAGKVIDGFHLATFASAKYCPDTNTLCIDAGNINDVRF